MREDAQHQLLALVRGRARREGDPEPPLVPREDALRLLAAPVDAPRKLAAHRAARGRLGPALPGVPRIEPDRRAPDAERAVAEPMGGLAVKARVGHHGTHAQQRHRLAQDRLESGDVRRRSLARERASDEVRRGVHCHGELRMGRVQLRVQLLGPRVRGPARAPAHAASAAITGAMDVVEARGTQFERARVDGHRGAAPGGEARGGGAGEDHPLRGREGPPFSAPARRRCAA